MKLFLNNSGLVIFEGNKCILRVEGEFSTVTLETIDLSVFNEITIKNSVVNLHTDNLENMKVKIENN